MQFGFHFCSYKEWLLHLLYASKLSSLLMSTLPVNSIGVLFPSVHFHASFSEIQWGGSINVCSMGHEELESKPMSFQRHRHLTVSGKHLLRVPYFIICYLKWSIRKTLKCHLNSKNQSVSTKHFNRTVFAYFSQCAVLSCG